MILAAEIREQLRDAECWSCTVEEGMVVLRNDPGGVVWVDRVDRDWMVFRSDKDRVPIETPEQSASAIARALWLNFQDMIKTC